MNEPGEKATASVSRTRLILLASTVHLLIALMILAPLYVTLALDDSIGRPIGIGVALLGILVLVTWWGTRRAIDNLASSPRPLLVEGFRTGGLAGVRFLWGVLSLLLLQGLTATPSGSASNEQPGFGGPVALLVGLFVLIPIGYIVGSAFGGFIALIDRALLAIAHTTLAEIGPR